jgi:hypothetical protein
MTLDVLLSTWILDMERMLSLSLLVFLLPYMQYYYSSMMEANTLWVGVYH